MNSRSGKLVSSVVMTFAAVLLLLSANSVFAQSGSRPLRTERERIQSRMSQIYRSPDPFPKPLLNGRGPTARAIRLAAAKRIKKEAEQLQLLNDTMMRTVSTRAPLEYKIISKTADKIKESTTRLSFELGFPKLDEAAKSNKGAGEFDTNQIVASAMKLDHLIGGLRANPLVGTLGVLDAEQAARAGRDLEEIIVLSLKIKKSARSLGRTASNR